MNTMVEHINSAGRIFVEFALPMLIQSSVLIAILLLVDLLLRKKVKAVFRYWIWMLVLLKLILPTSLSSPLSLGYLFGDKLTYQDLAQTSAILEPTEPAPADISPGMDPLFIQPNPYIPPTEPVISVFEPAIAEPVSPPRVPVTPLSWQGIVFLVWLAVAIAMGLLLLQRALFVRGLVAQAKKAGCLMNDALAYCCASMGIKSKVGLKVSVNATTPSVCGLIRPVILMPWNLTSTLGASRLRTILMHELAHIKRGDLWVNLAQTALQIIYFYNPLFWLANSVIRRIREQAVDEAVLVAMGEKAQKYPQTLVDVAKMAFKRPALSLRLIGVVESKSALAGRIKHILSRPMPKTAKLGIIGLLVVIIAGAVLLPMARAQRLEFAGQGGPLDIRLAGVRPDGSDDVYDGGGNKIAENTFANIAKEWGEDQQHRTFIFELPVTEEPILFSPFLKIKPTGTKRGFGTGQHPLLYDSAGKLTYSVAVDFPRTYKKVFERRVKKVDLTLRYYYGQRGAADFVFSGPFTPAQTVKAEGSADCELTATKDRLDFSHYPAALFRISSKTRFDPDSVLVYDTYGRHYLPESGGGGSGSGGSGYRFRAEGLTLNSIAYVTVGEKPYEATFKNVVVSYPDRPVPERMEFLDEMCQRLDLTGFSGDLLNDYRFENPADAIKVIDIVRGRWYVMKVFRAIRYSEPRIELSSLDAQTQQKVRSAAAGWAEAGHPNIRAMGIRLGLVGGWPEFMDMALEWLEQDVVVYDMVGRTYRGLEEGAKEEIAVEVSSYPTTLNSEQAERLKKIILRTDSPRLGMRLFRFFWRADKDLIFQICRNLTQDDRPWIWWPAMYSLSNRCTEKLRPFENLPEKMQKRLILVKEARGGSSRLFKVSSSGKDYETVAKEAYAMLPLMFTAQLARMNGSTCHNVRQVMAKHLDREIATKAMTDFLREISTESNQRLWVGDSYYFGTCCSTAYYIACHINSLYDVNIDNLGKYGAPEKADAIPRNISRLKQLIAKTLQWYDDRSGENNDTGRAREIGAGNETGQSLFSATLPNGVTVELVGVCELREGQVQKWWRPDGKPFEKTVFLRPVSFEKNAGLGFLIATDRTVGIKWEIEGTTEHLGTTEIIDSNGQPTVAYKERRERVHFVSTDGLQKTEVILALTPQWHRKIKYDGQYVIEESDPKVKFFETYETPEGLKIIFRNDHRRYGNHLQAVLSNEAAEKRRMKRRERGEFRIHAKIGTVLSRDGEKRLSAFFEDVELSDVKYFELSTGPLPEKVVFKNVSLRSGMETDVQVEVEKTSQSQFSTTLPNGVTVELVGLCEHPSEGKQWWKPDGALWEDRPYEEFSSHHTSGEKGYELVWRLISDEDVVYEVESADQGGSGGQAVLHNERGLRPAFRNGEFYGVIFFFSPRLSQVAIGIGVGLDRNWKTIASLKGDVSKAQSSINNVHLYPAIEADGRTHIDAAYRFPEGKGHAYRIVAVDTSNKQHIMRQGSETKSRGGIHCRKQIDLPLKQIKTIHFQTQPLQRVTFENVSLRPGVQTDVHVEAEDSIEVEDDRERGSQFAATLPNGVMVELVGLCEHPSEGKQWWKPDGSSIEADGFRDYDFDDAIVPEDNQFLRLLALRFDDDVLQNIRFSWVLKDARESRFEPDYTDKERKRLRPIQVIEAAFPKAVQSTNLQLGVATGPWKSVAAGAPATGGAYTLDSITQGDVIYHEAREDNGYINISATHILGGDYDCRIVAKGKDGKVYEPSKYSNPGREMRLCKSEFDIPLEQVKWFYLQARPFQWVTFKNVSLRPGRKTDSEVEDKASLPGYEVYGAVVDVVPDSWREDCFARLDGAKSKKEFDSILESLSLEPKPAVGVTVKLQSMSRSKTITREAVTDKNGKYRFTSLPAAWYGVSCEKAVTETRTGQNRMAFAKGGRYRQGIAAHRRQCINLYLRDDYVTVKGRIADANGHPFAGVKVRGITAPVENDGIGETDEHTEAIRPQIISARSDDDGFYELTGFEPANLVAVTRYLANGSPGYELGHKFYVDVTVGADDNTLKRIPLVTEESLYRTRRVFKAYRLLTQRTGGEEVQEKQDLPHPFASSHGNTITGIDIVLGQHVSKEQLVHSTDTSRSYDLANASDFVREHFNGWKTEVRNNYLLKDHRIKEEHVLKGKTGAVAYVWFAATLENVQTKETKPFEAVYFLYRWHTDQWEGIFNTDGTNSRETEEAMEAYRNKWLPSYLRRVEQGYTRVGSSKTRTPPVQEEENVPFRPEYSATLANGVRVEQPATIRVPEDYPTEYAAVEAAKAGDTIVISAGRNRGDDILIEPKLEIEVEETISPKLVMLLGAINSCAAETELNIESISIKARDININGDTSRRTDTQKFLDTIKKNGLKILRLSLDTRGNRDRFSIDVEPKKNRQQWPQHKTGVLLEKIISPKLVMLLGAINSCAAETKLNIESISIKDNNIKIAGDTAGRTDTLKFLDAVKKNEMEVLQLITDAKGNREKFSITAEPKKDWQKWWQQHKTDVLVEGEPVGTYSDNPRVAVSAIVEQIKSVKHVHSGRGSADVVEVRTNSSYQSSTRTEKILDFRFEGNLSRSDAFTSEKGKRGDFECSWAVGLISSVRYNSSYGSATIQARPFGQFHRRLGYDFHPETFPRMQQSSIVELLEGVVKQPQVTLKVTQEPKDVIRVVSEYKGETSEQELVMLLINGADGMRLSSWEFTAKDSTDDGIDARRSSLQLKWRKYAGVWYISEAISEGAGVHDGLRSEGRTTVTIREFTPNVEIEDKEFTLDGLDIRPGARVNDLTLDTTYKYAGSKGDAADKLRKLSRAVQMYANDYDNKFPDTMQQLKQFLDEKELKGLSENVCYLGKGKTVLDSPEIPLAYDKTMFEAEQGKGTNVLFVSGIVSFRVREQLKKLGITAGPKTDVPIEVEDANPGLKALHITSHNDGLRIEFSDAQSIVLENGKVSRISSNRSDWFQATRLQIKLNSVTIELDGPRNRVHVSGLGCSAEITPQNGLIEVKWTDGNQTNIQKGGSLKILLPDFQITVYDKAGRRQSLLKPRQRKGLISGEAVQTDVLVGTEKPKAGEWEDIGNPIPADFNDTIALTERITLGSIGQDVEGKTFITFVWDKEKNRNRQYRFVLIKNNDTILEPDSHLILDENGRLEEKFTFDEPHVSWRSVEFKFQRRSPPLAGTRSISSKLQKETSTAFEGKTISPSRLAPPGRYAIELDGVDDYLLVPDSPTLRLDPPFTVEMWIKPRLPEQKVDRVQEWGVIAQGGYIGTGRVKTRGFGIELIRFEKEPAKFNISYCEASDSGIAGSDYGSYRFDDWIHISHVFEGGRYKPGPGHPLVVGKFLIPSAEPFMGQIGEVRIWNTARTRQEIRRYKDVALTGKEPGLVACWTFEQNEGQFAYDISGNNNHGRLGRSIEADSADPKWIDLEAATHQPGRIADVQVKARVSESEAEKYEGRTIDEWIAQWDIRVSDDIDAATNALIRIGRPAVPAMIEQIKKRSNHGWRAVGVLSKMGPEAEDALELLIEMALDKNLRFGDGRQSPTAYRGTVLYCLSDMKWARQRVISVLQRIAEDGEEEAGVRQQVIWVLRRVGKGAMPILQKLTEAEERSVRDAAHGAIGQLLEKEEGLSKDDYYTPLIEKDPFGPSVLQYLGNTKGIVSYGRPHPLTQKIKKLYRERLAKEPDAQLAWRLATIIQNGLQNTELMWAAPADSSKGRSPREDPTENYTTLAEVLQLGFDHAESGSQLQRQFGKSLAKLRLLQGDWNRMNAMLQALGQKPIPKESRQWLHAPPVDWQEDLRSQWKIADESMRSGNCSLEFKIEKAGKGLKGVHFLVKRAPEPTNGLYTGISADTLFFAPTPMKVHFGSFGYKGRDRPMTRYAISDESGIVRFEKLPNIPVKIEVLVPTSNFPEAVSNWDLWMEVEPGKFKIAKKYGGAEAVGGGKPPAVEELREGETVHYPKLVVRPVFGLNVRDWTRVDKDNFVLSWAPMDSATQAKTARCELEMFLSAPPGTSDRVTHAPVLQSAKIIVEDNRWDVGEKGVGELRLEPGNIYVFEIRALDASGVVIARWPRTRVWTPWDHRTSDPPYASVPLRVRGDVSNRPPIHNRVWHYGSFDKGTRRRDGLREEVARFLSDSTNTFEYEYVRMGKAWLDWHDDRQSARRQLEQLVKELPEGNVARGTALWLIQQIDENKEPPKRLNFVPDRNVSRSKAVSLPDEKTDAQLEVEQSSSESGGDGIVVVSKGKSTMYSSLKDAVDAAPAGSVIRVSAGVYGERPVLEVEQSGRGSKPGGGKIVVVSKGKSTMYRSIQEAIDAAPAGSVIRIGPGVYKERLEIDKPLTLEGAGWDQTTIVTENNAADVFEEAMRTARERVHEAKSEEEAKKLSAEFQAQFEAEMKEKLAAQTHLVSDTENVVIRNLKLTSPGRRIEGRALSVPVLKFSNARALVSGCAVVGTPGNGINIEEGSNVEVRDSLVAGVWSTGIAVTSGKGDIANARIINCDVRNCYHRGITIGPGCDSTVVRGCRISGSSWHGIRYDNASPRVIGNLIFANVRCGIYASGETAATVRQNLFYGNEMTGISCWYKNRDTIEANTFVGNKRSGIEVLGASRPIVQNNIFYANPTGVSCGNIGDDSTSATSDGTVNLKENLFWGFEHKVAWRHPGDAESEVVTEEVELDEKTENVAFDPEFKDITREDYSLKLDSPALRSGIGAADLIDSESPWPIQDEEIAIIPDGETEDTSWMGRISSTGKIQRPDVPVEGENSKSKRISGNMQDSFLDAQSILEGWKSVYGNIKSMRVSYVERVVDTNVPPDNPHILDNLVKVNRVQGSTDKLNAVQVYMCLDEKTVTYKHGKTVQMPRFQRLMEWAIKVGLVSISPQLEKVAGEPCHLININWKAADTEYRIWIAHDKGMYPIKRQRFVKGKLAVEVGVEELAKTISSYGDIWYPKTAYRIVNSQTKGTQIKYRLDVEQFVPNIEVDDEASEFATTLPNGETEDTSWMGRISSTDKIERPVVPVANEGGKKPQESIKAKPRQQESSEHPGRISGVVINSDTGDPIVGAYVGVGDFGDSGGSNYSRHRSQGFHDKTKTDAEGRFELGGLVFTDKHRYPEYHPLVVTHPDFVRHDEKIELLSSGPVPEVKVSLMPAAKIDLTIVDADGNPLEGQWLIRLEALDGRRFIPPGSDPHLSSFASSVWMKLPDLRRNMGTSDGFSFTELDTGEYLIEAIRLHLVDKPTPQKIWETSITYHGAIEKLKVEAGRTKQVQIKPANHQTAVTLKMPETPEIFSGKQEIPRLLTISRKLGLLLWDTNKVYGLEDPRLGRLQKNAFFYTLIPDSGVFTIKNLPPGSYCVFAGPVMCMSAAKVDVIRGRQTTIQIPKVEFDGTPATVGVWTLDRKVKLQAKRYSVKELVELLTEKTESNPRIIADPSIENEKLRFGKGQMSVWDVLEKLYLDKGWRVDEGKEKTLIIRPPAVKSDV